METPHRDNYGVHVRTVWHSNTAKILPVHPPVIRRPGSNLSGPILLASQIQRRRRYPAFRIRDGCFSSSLTFVAKKNGMTNS